MTPQPQSNHCTCDEPYGDFVCAIHNPQSNQGEFRESVLRLMRYANTLSPHKLKDSLDPVVEGAIDDWLAGLEQERHRYGYEVQIALLEALQPWINKGMAETFRVNNLKAVQDKLTKLDEGSDT